MRKITCLLLVLLALVACWSGALTETVPKLPFTPPAIMSVTPQPTTSPETPLIDTAVPTSTPTVVAVEVIPPGMASFRGVSSYDLTRRFSLLYALDTWQRDGNWLWNQAIPDCGLYPQAAGMGLSHDWSHTTDWVTLGDWQLERHTFTQAGEIVPTLVTYGLSVDETYFLFQSSSEAVDQAAFDRCRADVEAVLATFTPLEPLSGEFAVSRAALEVYEPPHGWEWVSRAVEGDIVRWLAEGNDPVGLAVQLRALPKLDAAAVPEAAVIDLNGDGLQDVVVQTQLMGLPVIACLAQEGSGFVGQLLPLGFDEPLPTMVSSFLVSDLTGDGQSEILVDYTVQGGSGWTELLYVYKWRDLFTPVLVFRASLLNWAGASTWALEPAAGQPDQQRIVLAYPYLYGQGFDHKMVNHPLAREVWRWDADAGSFVFAERTVDLKRSGWGPEASPIAVEDRLRWLTNEGEEDFRSGEYEAATGWYDQVLVLAAVEGWTPADGQPDWTGFARFRRAETLALEAHSDEVLTEMQAIVDEYADDPLSELAAAFLASYGDGGAPDAAARGVAAMQRGDLYTHFYSERGSALRFPMDAAGILYPGAGLAAYLDAHLELADDAAALLEDLREVGFAAEQVWLKSAGDEAVLNGDVVIVLRLPDAPNAGGALVSWALARSGGRWKVVPSVALPENAPAWPSVGGLADPVRGQVTLWEFAYNANTR